MDDSGVISLDDGVIRYQWARGSWELPLSQVLVIGESTTDHGPFIDECRTDFRASSPALASP
jgi:hypothetical protein